VQAWEFSGAILVSDVSTHPHCRELVELRERLAKKEGDGEALESEIEVCTSELPLQFYPFRASTLPLFLQFLDVQIDCGSLNWPVCLECNF
jgi:hypothetical protein